MKVQNCQIQDMELSQNTFYFHSGKSFYLFPFRRIYQSNTPQVYKRTVALFNKILTIKNCRRCKTKIKKSFTKILTIILSVKIVLTLRVKLPRPKCKILIVREILVLSFIVSEKNRKKDGRCIGAST